MKKKWPLLLGIVLLVAGIVLKKTTDTSFGGILLIITGVLFKTYYVICKIKSGEYKPGYELGLLLAGLFLFFGGIYLRSQGSSFNPAFLMAPGITLKVAFIVLIVRKTKAEKDRD